MPDPEPMNARSLTREAKNPGGLVEDGSRMVREVLECLSLFDSNAAIEHTFDPTEPLIHIPNPDWMVDTHHVLTFFDTRTQDALVWESKDVAISKTVWPMS